VYWGAKLPDSFRTYATPPVDAENGDAARSPLPTIDPHWFPAGAPRCDSLS